MRQHSILTLLKHPSQAMREERERAASLQERAVQLRRLAETEPSERLRRKWLDLAERYEEDAALNRSN